MQVAKVHSPFRWALELSRQEAIRQDHLRIRQRAIAICGFAALPFANFLRDFAVRIALAGLALFVQVGTATAATMPLKATTFPVSGSSDDPLKQIWADKIAAAVANQEDLRRSVPSLKPLSQINAEVATFVDGSTTIIVSFIDSRVPQECASFSNVGLPESIRECPLRIALVRDGKPKTVFSADKYCMAFKFTRTTNVYDDRDSRVKTEVTYDPQPKTISIKALDNGRDVCDSQAPIPLNF